MECVITQFTLEIKQNEEEEVVDLRDGLRVQGLAPLSLLRPFHGRRLAGAGCVGIELITQVLTGHTAEYDASIKSQLASCN